MMTDDGRQVLVKLGLSKKMKEDLETAGGSRGTAAEVRRRLDASFLDDKLDPKTQELLAGIKEMARAFDLDDAWGENRFSFEVFKAGVLELLSQYQPAGPVEVGPKHLGVAFNAKDDPETAGRMLARFVRREFLNALASRARADAGAKSEGTPDVIAVALDDSGKLADEKETIARGEGK